MLRRIKNIYHLGQSITGKIWFNVSVEGVTFIGVTGTDGKTTTSNLLYNILTEAGYNTALISTISAVIGKKTLDTGFHVTTPGPLAMQSYVKKAVKDGATHIILEVTSHALDQYRVHGIPFHIGILTNITNEHLDYHKTYDNYVAAKTKLLLHSENIVINADDESYKKVTKLLKNKHYGGRIITYALHNKADVTLKTHSYRTNLIGEFNQYNTLASVAAAEVLGIEGRVIQNALRTFTPPVGRTEIVHEGDFTVMIDFAHTPNSISQLLKTVKSDLKPKGRIIHVFGSAGERDSTKRKAMGEASSEFADVIILTAEDPRSESVEKISNEIASGIKNQATLEKIDDRAEAIKHAIRQARHGDLIVITGKGHERSMNFGHGETPWNEHEAVKEALEGKGN